jgi:hypothetical protein
MLSRRLFPFLAVETTAYVCERASCLRASRPSGRFRRRTGSPGPGVARAPGEATVCSPSHGSINLGLKKGLDAEPRPCRPCRGGVFVGALHSSDRKSHADMHGGPRANPSCGSRPRQLLRPKPWLLPQPPRALTCAAVVIHDAPG